MAKKKKVDRVKRRVVADLLSHYNTELVLIGHELYRVCGIHGSGLTEKENVYLRKRLAELQELSKDIAKIRERCNHSAGI